MIKINSLGEKIKKVMEIDYRRYKLEKVSLYINIFLLVFYSVLFIVGAMNHLNDYLLIGVFVFIMFLNYLVCNSLFFLSNYELNLTKKITFLIHNNDNKVDDFISIKNLNSKVNLDKINELN